VARKKQAGWDAYSVRALRRHMRLSQDGLAAQLGTRQQTVSEWETGRYRPRGASATLLTMIAERAEFEYLTREEQGTRIKDQATESQEKHP
jgi:DNA-binding transcriptional regulator YiaG